MENKNATAVLMDDYRITGTDFGAFQDEIVRIDTVTEVHKIFPEDVNMFGDLSVNSYQDTVSYRMITPSSIRDANVLGDMPAKITSKYKKYKRDIFEETAGGSGLILFSEDSTPIYSCFHQRKKPTAMGENKTEGKATKVRYHVAEPAVAMLASRVGAGSVMIARKGLIRDLWLMQSIVSSDKPLVCVSRATTVEDTDLPKGTTMLIRKLLGVFGGTYQRIPFQSVADTVKDIFSEVNASVFGKPEIVLWEIQQRRISIRLEFPEKGREMAQKFNLPEMIIPGLALYASDCGDMSLTAKMTYRLEDSEVFVADGKVTRENNSSFKYETFFHDVRKMFLLGMNDLGQVFSDPGYDKTICRDESVKQAKKTALVNKLLLALHVTGAVGKTKEGLLRDRIVEKLSGISEVTPRELVHAVLDYDSSALTERQLFELEEALGRAPYLASVLGGM